VVLAAGDSGTTCIVEGRGSEGGSELGSGPSELAIGTVIGDTGKESLFGLLSVLCPLRRALEVGASISISSSSLPRRWLKLDTRGGLLAAARLWVFARSASDEKDISGLGVDSMGFRGVVRGGGGGLLDGPL
jgi:hypothetical protein